MAEPFLAEIKIVGFNFPPRGWAQCDGQMLPINQNQALFSLLGTNFGGDGRTSFGLPDLRGRAPMHEGGNPGLNGGAENVSLTTSQIPSHDHALRGTTNAAATASPSHALHATPGGGRRPVTPYVAGSNVVSMQPTAAAGSGQGHNNMQPFLALNFVIALQGVFPSRN
jgi:microcystin-dependent protein